MGSRIGSIAILLVIAAIVAAVVIVISRLDLLDSGQANAPVMVVSLDEGELVLLNQPQSITVTISSGNPIATMELFVDAESISSVIPSYSQTRGSWIGTFVWTPSRLGFADVQIIALNDQGAESVRVIRVETTDDQARVAAALRVEVLGIAPLQQFVSGTSIRLAISASGSEPIERFDMLVDDRHLVSVTPFLELVPGHNESCRIDQAQADCESRSGRIDENCDCVIGHRNTDRYIAWIDWTPQQSGEVQVTITAVDITGVEESRTIPVILFPQDDSPPTRDSNEREQETPTEDRAPNDDEPTSEIGAARIESPSDGQRFTLDSEFAVDVELVARNVGSVASALLYITPIAPDNTLGNSILIHSSEGHATGDYSEVVADVERYITSSGSYELQLVVFTPEKDRYDDRIVIHVVAVADDEEEQASTGDSGEEDEGASDSDEIDLAIVTARQVADDRSRLNVSITNASTVDIEHTNVLITVVDASNGAELASAAVTFGIESDDVRTIPLDLNLEPGTRVEALVVLEASVDTNTRNNTFQISLSAPDDMGNEQDQQVAPPDDDQEDQEQANEPAPQETGPQPDLTFLDAQATSDGYVLLTVINKGADSADTFFIVIANQAGEQLEVITRRDADAQPLASGGTEILTSLQPHSGTLSITVVTGGNSTDLNTVDNEMTLEIRQ